MSNNEDRSPKGNQERAEARIKARNALLNAEQELRGNSDSEQAHAWLAISRGWLDLT